MRMVKPTQADARARRTRGALLFGGLLAALLWGLTGREPAVATGAQRPAADGPTLSGQGSHDGGMVRQEFVLMGSLFTVVVEAEQTAGRAAIDKVQRRLRELEERVSSWRPRSEVAALNASAGGAAVEVSPDTLALLELAKATHAETRGAFDATIGPLWDLWPFRDPTAPLPSKPMIGRALALVDASSIELDADAGKARLPKRGMAVNLGGIGKGFAAKLAIEVLAQEGLESAAVSAGGDLFVGAPKSTGPWRVEIENPRWPGRAIEHFTASHLALATSGDTHRRIVRDGKVYGHVLDPRTGQPVAGLQSASVLTADPVRADAFATALLVMGLDRGLSWIEQLPGVEAVVVDAGGRVHRSTGFGRLAGGDADLAPVDTAQPPAQPPALVRAGRLTRRDPLRPVRDAAYDPSPRSTPPLPKTRATRPRARTGAMVQVPGGVFTSATTGRTHRTSAFHINRMEVSNASYRRFLDGSRDDPHDSCHPLEPAGKDHTPRYWGRTWRPTLLRQTTEGSLAPFDLDTFRVPDHPVVGVDWWDAYAYARWAGKRLPSAGEFEKAACGDDGRAFPWGKRFVPGLANIGGEMNGERDGHTYAAPVSAFRAGASPHGALNMAGNVAEWTAEGRVMGGGSSSVPSQVRCGSGRMRDPAYRSFVIGIRTASGAP